MYTGVTTNNYKLLAPLIVSYLHHDIEYYILRCIIEYLHFIDTEIDSE